MRLAILLGMVSLALSTHPAWAGDLNDARRLAMAGRHCEARNTARRVLVSHPNDPEALQIIVVASCELGDRTIATLAAARLAPDVQATAVRLCARRGVVIGKGRPMAPEPMIAPGPAAEPDPRRPWRTASWIALATTGVSLITWGALMARTYQLEKDKEELILSRRLENHRIYSAGNVCDEAEASGDGALAEVCRNGKRSAVAANVMLGVGLVSAVVGGYLYYRGYIRREEASPRLSIGPGGGSFSVAF